MMFTFFRKIRGTLIGSDRLTQYILYAIGEILLVVIGILIALQINNWNEERMAIRVEKQYMNNLLIDLAKDKVDLENSIAFGPIPVHYNDSLFTELQKRPLRGNEKRIYHFLLLYTNEIELHYHDRTISQLRNSGGFGLIRDQDVSDAVLDYDVQMRESIRYIESSRTNHIVNSEIQHQMRIFETYLIQNLQDSAIAHREEMHNVNYPDHLALLSYDESDIKIALNYLSSVRSVDESKYQNAIKAHELNERLDSLIRDHYKLSIE